MCEHKKIFNIGGKSSDMNGWTIHSGLSGDGYVPSCVNDGSDYFKIKVCVDCHKMLNFDREAYDELARTMEEEAVQNAFFDQYRTVVEVAEELGWLPAKVINVSVNLFRENRIRFVTTDDCQVFDHGAMTADYMWEEC